MPRQSAGPPPFDDIASDVIAHARGQRRALPLTPAEKEEAARVAEKDRVCRLCLGYHALSELSPPGCPRLASFELDGDGKVKAGTFWPGRKWAQGRVEFVEDTLEQEADDGDH